jgi:hypothetical protein
MLTIFEFSVENAKIADSWLLKNWSAPAERHLVLQRLATAAMTRITFVCSWLKASIVCAGTPTQGLSGRLEVTQRETSKKADRRRTRFNIPSVRNPVAESITCGRLGLDLDGSIRAANRGLEQPRRTSRDHLVGANTVGRISRSRDRMLRLKPSPV